MVASVSTLKKKRSRNPVASFTELGESTVLPGLTVDAGAIVYDPDKLTWPGDLLHEAGHLAFTPAAERPQVSIDTPFDLGHDFAAIAWSWAALTHLQLDPRVVFHDGGYYGWSAAYIDNFSKRRYVGVSLLQWADMTTEGEFPSMLKWLRD